MMNSPVERATTNNPFARVTDNDWMKEALALARKAMEEDQVPVGALVVYQDKIRGTGYNRTTISGQICDHAEMLAIREANQSCKSHLLTGATIYVTLEPCLMCLGAIVHARISRLVFGAYEPKTGAVVSCYQLGDHPGHAFDWCGGVLGESCAALLSDFFCAKR